MHGGLRSLSLGPGVAALLLLVGGEAGAHSFPERAEPRVGAVVHVPPGQVRIWFDGDLEPAFSRVTVTRSDGQAVDLGDARVDPQSHRLLRVGLPALPPGTYRVRWSVVSVDGHRTQGDYTFTIAPAE